MTDDALKPPPPPVFNLPPRRAPAPPSPSVPLASSAPSPPVQAPPPLGITMHASSMQSLASASKFTPQGVLIRLRGIQRALADSIGQRPGSRLYAAWQRWDARLARLAREAESRPQVAIALVGGTGAGKSTLVNALLEERLLPVSNMRACTAAISEVAYAEDGRYSAAIEFVPRASWEMEIADLLEDLRDDRQADDEGDSEGSSPIRATISQAARDKIRAVYGIPEEPSEGRADSRWHWPDLDSRRLREQEPPEITSALDAGEETVSSETIEDFRKVLDKYLNGKNRFWPIVKAVRIRGPFAALRGGATLIDLPGINDPNEAREEVTRRYLKECRFVWIVFNIKRVLTKDLLSLMQSDDFLRQVVLDGRENALTLIGTASDDIDVDAGRAEFNLDDEEDETGIILARNRAVRVVVKEQLAQLASQLAMAAHAEPQRAEELARSFQTSGIYTVSAREYLRLSGASRTKNVVLDSAEQTEIPELRNHMDAICEGYGVEAQARSHHRQLDLLLDEIDREVQVQERALRQLSERSEQERKEAEAAVQTANTFLDQRLDTARVRFRDTLEASQGILGERMKLAVERARHGLDQTTVRWGAMHWCTVRAVVRRDGVYNGTTGRHDFARDIADPILNAITFAWAEFFGDRLGQALETNTEQLLRLAADHGRDLRSKLAAVDARRGAADTADEALERLLATTEKVLRELVSGSKIEMRRTIDDVRRSLYEEIPRQVQANMRRAFAQASEERGSGMKRRMVDTLATHARSVSREMFADTEEAITEGVRNLIDSLDRSFQGMATTVRDHAGIGSRQLTTGIGELPANAIAQEQADIRAVDALLSSLRRDAATA